MQTLISQALEETQHLNSWLSEQKHKVWNVYECLGNSHNCNLKDQGSCCSGSSNFLPEAFNNTPHFITIMSSLSLPGCGSALSGSCSLLTTPKLIEKWLCHQGSTPLNGLVSCKVGGDKLGQFFPSISSATWEHGTNSTLEQGQPSPDTASADTWILVLSSIQNWTEFLLFIKHSVSVILLQ